MTYTAELLSKHHDPRREGRSANARNSEELGELGEEVLALVGLPFELDTHPCIVGITSGLHVIPSEALERAEGFVCLAVLDIPSADM